MIQTRIAEVSFVSWTEFVSAPAWLKLSSSRRKVWLGEFQANGIGCKSSVRSKDIAYLLVYVLSMGRLLLSPESRFIPLGSSSFSSFGFIKEEFSRVAI
jgi:hypothetical protein